MASATLPSDAKQLREGQISLSIPPITNDRFFFLANFFEPTLEIIIILPIETPLIHASHFVLTSFPTLLSRSSVTKLGDVHYNQCLAQGKKLGQNIRVITVYLTKTKMLDLLVVFIRHAKIAFSSPTEV